MDELNRSCVSHQPRCSLLMCCHGATESSIRERPERVGQRYRSWGRTHECVGAVGASLWPGKELSWQSVTRLFSPVCLSVCQMHGPSWMGPRAVNPHHPCLRLHHPLSRAESLSPPISSRFTVVGQAALSKSAMATNTVNDFTPHEMLTGLSKPLIDWPPFTARCGFVNWSPAPCWHSDPNGRELLLSRHALTSPLFFFINPSSISGLTSAPPPHLLLTLWFHSSWLDRGCTCTPALSHVPVPLGAAVRWHCQAN